MGRVVVHVGYPKCGSSSLQGNLFGVHPGIDYLSTNVQGGTLTDFQADPRTEDFFLALMDAAPAGDDRVRAIWADHYAPALRNDRTTVLSEESLLCATAPPEDVLSRIASIAPDAHILMVLRDQVELLRSYYDMYPTIGEGRAGRYAPFPVLLRHALAGGIHLVERLKYSAAIDAARCLFGPERVHILDFDRLFRAKSDAPRLAACLHIREQDVRHALAEPRLNDHHVHTAKKFTRRMLGPIHASDFVPYGTIRRTHTLLSSLLPAQRTQVTEAEHELIERFYADDNDAARRILRNFELPCLNVHRASVN